MARRPLAYSPAPLTTDAQNTLMSPMTHERIIREIKRTAEANGGRPLGSRNFAKASGIAESASRIFWARWSDALREAGYAPNEPPATYTDAFVAESLVRLTRSLGHYPTWRDWNIERRRDPNFPSVETTRRMGGVEGVMAKVAEYCHERLVRSRLTTGGRARAKGGNRGAERRPVARARLDL